MHCNDGRGVALFRDMVLNKKIHFAFSFRALFSDAFAC